MATTDDRTIRDFGEQWARYGANDGFYASLELLQDALGPLLGVDRLRGVRAADIGSGTGRIVQMLLEAGARHVIAVEPSDAAERLRERASRLEGRVEVIHGRGEALPSGLDLDLVTSIGVLQFVRDPRPLLRAAFAALRPGGKVVIWVYGREGNAAYRLGLGALRLITPKLPHTALSALCSALNGCLDAYIWACRWLPLPLRDYVRNVLARVSRQDRKLTIYDQLNPSFVRFYRGEELRALLEGAGFRDVALHHRRGYSWTALGVKPPAAAPL